MIMPKLRNIILTGISGYVLAKISTNIAIRNGLNFPYTCTLILTYGLSLFMLTKLTYELITKKEKRTFENIVTLPIPALLALNSILLLLLAIRQGTPYM